MATRAKTDSTNKNDAAANAGSISATGNRAAVQKQANKGTAQPAAKITAKTATSTGAAPRSTTKSAASKVTAKPTKKPAEKPAVKTAKPKKAKMIRDSFTMPEAEYSLIAAIKKRCIARGIAVKKSEVLRAAILGLAAQTDAAVTAAVKALAAIKTGRPPKGQK